jgi:hypothetical protein
VDHDAASFVFQSFLLQVLLQDIWAVPLFIKEELIIPGKILKYVRNWLPTPKGGITASIFWDEF